MDYPYDKRKLNRLLSNYFVLSIKLLRYEWYAKGPFAFSNKQLFLEFRTEVNNDIDKLAAFITGLGGRPFATMAKFLKESTIEEATADDEEEEMIEQLINDFTVMNEQIETIKQDTDEAVKHLLFSLQSKLKKKLYICKQMQE